jgi:hypothetical protein
MPVEMRNLMLPLLGVGVHRAKLEDPERTARGAYSYLPEEDGPWGVDLDHQRKQCEDRCQDDERGDREREIHSPLEQAGGARKTERRQAEERQALDGMDLDSGADEFEQARHDVDLDFEILHGAKQLERLLVRIVREGDDHALDVEQADDRRKSPCVAEQRNVPEVALPLLRLAIDEPDEIDPVLRMVQNLLREELADITRADDDRVLGVGYVPPR